MAKAQGIIGNFKGKVGNMVGYQLTDSNNKQTQGIRIYQPNVKNPKTSAQAEQRARLAPINATYRALKMVIDRGNEGLPYGNKSRLAWLKQAFKANIMPWIEKGMSSAYPVGCFLTKGSLPSLDFDVAEGVFEVNCSGITAETSLQTVGALSTALLAGYPSLKAGDQVTIVFIKMVNNAMDTTVVSYVIDTTSNEPTITLTASAGKFVIKAADNLIAGTVIVSREGDNGEHLRSNSRLSIPDNIADNAPYDADSKTAAIASYMAAAGANSDWAEESID